MWEESFGGHTDSKPNGPRFEMYRVFRKNCVFFTIHCNPSLAYNSVKDILSS